MRIWLLALGGWLTCVSSVFAASIGGHVTRSSNNQAVQGASVFAFRSSDLQIETQQQTGADGSYALSVAAGSYLIVASAEGLVGEAYDNVPCPPCDGNGVVAIVVSAVQVVGGIDFALDPAHTIGGTVRHAGSLLPIENALVAIESSDGTSIGQAATDAAGHFAVFASDGSYRVRVASGAGALGQYYAGLPCNLLLCDPTGATMVPVAGADVSGIDFTLAAGGAISGSLRAQSDNTLLDSGAQLELYLPDGNLLQTFASAGANFLTSEPLPAGNYRLVARPNAAYLPKLWNNRACGGGDGTTCLPAQGDNVVVSAGATSGNINFSFVRSTATVAGHVSAFAGGAPLAGVSIEARRESDASIVQTLTQGDGSYLLEVPAGDYTVRASAGGSFADEFYPNVQCMNLFTCGGTPQVLPLAGGTDHAGVDFALAPAGSITIGVRDGASNALIGAELRLLLPGFEGPRQFIGVAGSATTIPVLSGGAVRFAARNDGSGCGPAPLMDCLGELYPDLPCPGLQCDLTLGDALNVAKGEAVTGIELVLGKGANLTGHVAAANTLAAIAAATIEIVDANNILVASATSDGGGDYQASGLGAGPYFARTRTSGFLDELYNDRPCPGSACSPVTGDPLTTVPGQTLASIDFVLVPGATINGKVRSAANAQAIANATVTVLDQSGQQVALAGTGANGIYSTRALAAGSYRVRFDAAGFGSLLFDGVACTPVSCDPASGTPVVLAPPANATGVNADLAGGASGAQNPKIVYLDNCKPNGCTVKPGAEDSRTNSSTIVPSQRSLPAFPFSDNTFEQVAQCVRATFAPFSVSVVSSDPGTASHREFMFTTLPVTIDQPVGLAGVSPWACGVPLENSIAFGFASAVGDNVAELCDLAAHEIGHQLGLDHEFYCPDHMTYLQGCGAKAFADVDVECGTFTPEACYCGSAVSQNTFAKIAAVAGLSTRIFSDGFDGDPAAFFFGKRLGPQSSGSLSCGTDTRRPNALQPWFDQR